MLNETGNKGARERGTASARLAQKSHVILSDRSPQDGGSRRICGCFLLERIFVSAAERKATIE